MKSALKIGLILTIAIISFLFVNKRNGYFDIPLFSVPNDSVRIKFKNDSDKIINAIHINGRVISTLGIGNSYIYTYKHTGEGTYQFEVEFEKGEKLKEEERYVEEGYYITEIIKNKSIESNY